MDLKEEIGKLAESVLPEDQFIVDVVATIRNGPGKILIILDGDRGVNIDDCAEVSRKLSKLLDESGLLDQNYLLEVSTPGVEHPLKLKRQYHKHIGRLLKIRLRGSEETKEGRLSAVDGEKIVLNQEIGAGKQKQIQTAEIPFADIEKTFVLVSFK